MSVLDRLAVSLGRRDESPNIELARDLARSRDKAAVNELVEALKKGNQVVRSDCIKVLYELGGIAPELISPYADEFLALLRQKNNRLVWGAMAALAAIAGLEPAKVYENLDTVFKAIDKGTVITVDKGISVLAKTAAADRRYEDKIVPFLLNHLETCRPKEVPQHSERSLVAVNSNNAERFRKVLTKRMTALTPRQANRVEKVLNSF